MHLTALDVDPEDSHMAGLQEAGQRHGSRAGKALGILNATTSIRLQRYSASVHAAAPLLWLLRPRNPAAALGQVPAVTHISREIHIEERGFGVISSTDGTDSTACSTACSTSRG